MRQVLHARGREINAANTDCVPASLFPGVEERTVELSEGHGRRAHLLGAEDRVRAPIWLRYQ